MGEEANPRLPPEPELPPRMWGVGEIERQQLEREARQRALEAVAKELEARANHIGEAIKWVRADRLDVAQYLAAVRHGLKLGAIAARATL